MDQDTPVEAKAYVGQQETDELDEFELDQSDNDSEHGRENERPIHKELQEIINAIRDDKVNWKDKSKIREFFSQAKWPRLLQNSEVKGNNLLHLLVMEQQETQGRRRNAVEAVAKLWPQLMSDKNDEHRTPLYLALENEKMGLVRAMLRAKMITQALEVKCSGGENCLAYALRSRKVPADMLADLVNKATFRAINEKDNRNWTPLHLAADYTESSEERLKLIRTLIEKGENRADDESEDIELALDVYAGPEKMSVYEYHVQTREKAKMAPAKSRTTERPSGSSAPAKVNEERKAPADREPERSSQAKRQEQEREGAPGKAGPQGRGKEGPAAQRANNPSPEQTTRKEGPGSARPEANKDSDDQLDVPSPRAPGGQNKAVNFQASVVQADLQHEQKRTIAEAKAREKDKWSDMILAELKLYCMRTRSIRQATRFLHGKAGDSKIILHALPLAVGKLTKLPDVHLFFDYSGLPEEVNPNSFEKNFKSFTFDEVLHYVHFSRSGNAQGWLTKEPTMKAFTDEHGEFWKSKSTGRKDLLYFFNWLHRKKVKHIIRLHVDESHDSLHCEEAIEKALHPFHIDILSWSKPDLDPDMLCRACPDVQELHLRWSGNNAVLRSWSEADGLRRLKHLSRVCIYYDETLETTGRMQTYIEAFSTRLSSPPPLETGRQDAAEMNVAVTSQSTHQHFAERQAALTNGTRERTAEKLNGLEKPLSNLAVRRAISVQFPHHGNQTRPNLTRSSSTSASASEPMTGSSAAISTTNFPHRWLDSIDEFASEMRDLWRCILAEQDTHDVKMDDVKVALIDDGVDVCNHPIFDDKILDGKTFGYTPDGEKAKPWYVSESKHGTIMADMILRVCPMAKIYPLRLDTTEQKAKGSITIMPESAAEAIDDAVKKGVNIISMSWTVEPPKEGSTLRKKFDNALATAESKHILMFCSSSDAGNYTDEHYPTTYNDKIFFKIGAAKADGNPYDWVGPAPKLDYLFPGVEVVQRHSKQKAIINIDEWQVHTGSSISTALAAGLAALVISMAQIGVRYWDERGGPKDDLALKRADVEALQVRDNMKNAFNRCDALNQGGYTFLQIWKQLDDVTARLKQYHGDSNVKERKMIVADFARNLIKRTGGVP